MGRIGSKKVVLCPTVSRCSGPGACCQQIPLAERGPLRLCRSKQVEAGEARGSLQAPLSGGHLSPCRARQSRAGNWSDITNQGRFQRRGSRVDHRSKRRQSIPSHPFVPLVPRGARRRSSHGIIGRSAVKNWAPPIQSPPAYPVLEYLDPVRIRSPISFFFF
jgi:hypothetical protein